VSANDFGAGEQAPRPGPDVPPAYGPPPVWTPGTPPPPPPPSPTAPPAPTSLWERFRQHYDEAPVTVSIVVVTVAVWLVHLALQHWWGINTDLTLGDNGQGIHGQWWRLFTPMVVHFGILHIGLNMLVLWQIGPAVEKVIGHRWFLAFYIVCGVAGSVLSDAVLGSTALSGGASGAIIGIVGVLVGNTLVTHYDEAFRRRSTQPWRFNPKVARSLAIQVVIWIAFTSIAIKQIDNWAHIGGGVIGLFLGGILGLVRSEPIAA
jgi:rhomboid protease GluP